MSERSAVIKGRCFGPVVLTERTVTIPERILDGPVHLVQRAVTIPERKLSGPVHIVGHAFEVPPEDIEFSAFYATKMFGYIQTGWTTNIATRRKIKWRVKDTSNEWTTTGLTAWYVLTSTVPTTIPDTPSKEYEFYSYGITEGGTEEWAAMRYLTVDYEGDVTIRIYGEG